MEVFGRTYLAIYNASYDWPYTFLHPGCFCLAYIMMMLYFKGAAWCLFWHIHVHIYIHILTQEQVSKYILTCMGFSLPYMYSKSIIMSHTT